MGRPRTLKLDEKPIYPTNDEARSKAFDQWADVNSGKDPHTSFIRKKFSPTINTLASWGVNGIFFVYAFPPAGFTIKEPNDVLKLQTFEGWMFEYKPGAAVMNLLVKASRDGVAFFWQQHNRIKHI